jgi:hypothetical protein
MPVRRVLIQLLLPGLFCLVPLLAAVLVAAAIPWQAQEYYLDRVFRHHFSPMDGLILGLGLVLFLLQMLLTFRALRWQESSFDERPDYWLSNLAQAAEWFPLLGLLGTVAGILQTFGSIHGPTPPERIIALYAPAITATGSGLFMALVNILPTWVVLIGRQILLAIAGGAASSSGEPAT